MSYQIFPNLVFIFSVLGILLIILRRLPEASLAEANSPKEDPAHIKLIQKGLPAEALSKITTFFKFWAHKIWNFMLEAKDLKPHALAGYKMKKMFSKTAKPAPAAAPKTLYEVKNENYYLEIIKLEPKNYGNYDSLGKFYLEQNSYEDARDIYLYLTSHKPTSPDFYARLAYCNYQLKDYPKAVDAYQKAVTLDSTQPNRYYNLGLSQEAAGAMPEAIKTFEKAISMEPVAKYYISLSNAYIRMGNADLAKKALLTAQEKEPQNETVKARLERFAVKN